MPLPSLNNESFTVKISELLSKQQDMLADDAVNGRKQTHEVEARFVVFELICENKQLEIT